MSPVTPGSNKKGDGLCLVTTDIVTRNNEGVATVLELRRENPQLGIITMTPKRFAAQFESFEYEFHPEVQSPDVFLSSRRGDCRDCAILADYVLKRKDFGTRLVRVSLVGRIAHEVCYVVQSKACLDYNNRKWTATRRPAPSASARLTPLIRAVGACPRGSLR